MIDKNGKISLLASDKTSLINKMVDYTADSINVFLIDPEESIDIDKVRIEIQKIINL